MGVRVFVPFGSCVLVGVRRLVGFRPAADED